MAKGNKAFHPKRINWSYLKRGSVHRIHINTNPKKVILTKNTSVPIIVSALWDKPKSSINGKLYPPKNKAEIIADEINILMYSANR